MRALCEHSLDVAEVNRVRHILACAIHRESFLGLNLTQPLRPQKTFAMYGACKKVSQLNLTQHLSYVCIAHTSTCVQPNLTQIWLLLVYCARTNMAHANIWRTQAPGAHAHPFPPPPHPTPPSLSPAPPPTLSPPQLARNGIAAQFIVKK